MIRESTAHWDAKTTFYRRCSHEGCGARLSAYNHSDLCEAHKFEQAHAIHGNP